MLLSRLNAQTPSDLSHKRSVAANLASIIQSIIASFKIVVAVYMEQTAVSQSNPTWRAMFQSKDDSPSIQDRA